MSYTRYKTVRYVKAKNIIKVRKGRKMFDNGSEILRFDCHLHTVSDKEFKYDGEDDKFISNYVDKLKSEGIGVGVITIHNKFDYEQYKALKKAANKSGIFILPGVELSVKEGASSVHMLVVFNPTEWISNGVDHISRMVGSMFLGIDDPGNENTCTENDMLTVIHELDKPFIMVPDRNAEHQAYKAVPIEIVGIVMRSMVKKLGHIFKFQADF